MRGPAIAGGLAILAAATWTVVTDAHLDLPHASLVCAMAAGTAAGAVAIARVRWNVGLVVALAVLSGESYGMLVTGERIIRHRESMAIADAEANPRLAAARGTLAAAKAALVEHDRAAVLALQERGCARECRAGLDTTRVALVGDRDKAQAALATIPSKGATPLADRLGVDPWALDLFMAALLSLGANGLACVLIAYGAHEKPKARTIQPSVVAEPEVPAERVTGSSVVPMRRRTTGNDAQEFVTTRLRPDAGESVSMRDVVHRYWDWCEARGLHRPDMATAMGQVAAVCKRASIEIELTASRDVVVRGVALVA